MSGINTNEWQVRREVLSDQSVVWNVVGYASDCERITIGAADRAWAYKIAAALNMGAAWVDSDPPADDGVYARRGDRVVPVAQVSA